LQGARDDRHWHKLNGSLAAFPNLPFIEALWDELGRHLFTLRTRGVTVPFNDVIVATIAIHHDVEVWARDARYPMMQKCLVRLRLYQEPP